jgi:hypothetical protein
MIWRICVFIALLSFGILAQGTKNPGSPSPTPTISSSSAPEEGWNMGLTIGAVTIDNQIYNQIGFRPEFVVGKFGLALDLTFYIDQDGNIRKDNWDSWNDLIEKFYYVRYGLKGDPFYAKAGAIDNYRLGYGILMNRYYNTIQYPAIIRTGLELGFQGENLGMDIMLNDFKELGRPGGVMAGRISYKIFGALILGANAVYDRNQYAALPDKDKDGYPDALDDFPKDKKYVVDTDGDGIPDSIDPDRDGDGYTDNSPDTTVANNNDHDFNPLTDLKPRPFNIKEAANQEQLGLGIDLGLPILTADYLQLTLYGQAAKFAYGNGWGMGAPGLLAKFGFINVFAEYRMLNEKFIPEYFNSTYEIERVTFVQDSLGNLYPVTKRQMMEGVNDKMQGYIAGADFFIGNIVTFSATYQNMRNTSSTISMPDFNTFTANLDLNTKMIPKIQKAGAYFYQQNVDELFKKQEGTFFGYLLQYEIAAGASLLLDYRTMYRDYNGDGKIGGSHEIVNITNVQTVFTF